MEWRTDMEAAKVQVDWRELRVDVERGEEAFTYRRSVPFRIVDVTFPPPPKMK